MEQEVLNALRPYFPDVEGHIMLEATTDRYNGHLLSANFQGLTFVERQKQVFDILRQAIGPETQCISMLFTYTPDEYELLQAA